MKSLNKLSRSENDILEKRRTSIWKMNLSILSGEQMKKREETFKRRLDFFTNQEKVYDDMSSQKEFFINKKRYLMKLRNNLAKTCMLINEGEYKDIINNQNIDKLLDLTYKVYLKILNTDIPLEGKYCNYLYDYKCAKDDTTD